MSNPYDKIKDEAKYMAYDHGSNSPTKEDNPYMDMQGDPEAAKLSSIWLQGFNSNKKRPKPAKKAKLESDDEFGPVTEEELDNARVILKGGNVQPTLHTSGYLHVEPLGTDQLIEQLKLAATLELAKLEEQNKELFAKINKLKTIMEL